MTALTGRAGARPAARISLALVLAVGLLVAIAALALLALALGTPQLSLADLDKILFQGGGTRLARIVVLQLRLPRLLMALMAGSMLALAGVVLQDSLRNALAGPELLGVSAGASIVIAAVTIFHIPVLLTVFPFLALAGGMLAGAFVILTMRRLGDPVRLVLMGVAVNALLYAGIISITVLGSQTDVSVLYLFLLGSLANRTWPYVQLVAPWALVGIPLALLAARPLNLLQLGDEVAEGLGLRVVRMRLWLALLSAGLVAAVVAACGPISYVSLAAPHLARRLLRTTDARAVLPIAALIGATLLLGADLLAKNLLDPLELPVGIWTTIIGGPVLVLLLRRQLGGPRSRS
jgi:iron complex transport system permease protein